MMKLIFKNAFYFIQHIQYIIITTCNHYLNIGIFYIPFIPFSIWNLVCILNLEYIGIWTNYFKVSVPNVASGYHIG